MRVYLNLGIKDLDKVSALNLQMYEKFVPRTQSSLTTPIPVYQRPIELYQEPTPKRKNQGVDFNNLILLTKNSIKTRRGHAKSTAQSPSLPDAKQSLRTSGHKMQVQWLGKDHRAKNVKEIAAVNALVSELRSFEEKCECDKRAAGAGWKIVAAASQSKQRSSETARSKDRIFGNEIARCKTLDAEGKDKKTKRPLYRDVLANASSGAVLESVFEKRRVEFF